MKRTLLLFILVSSTFIGFTQPVLHLTPVNLSGPDLVDPVDITGCGDGSGRLFVVEKKGTIQIIQDEVVLPTPFLNIQDSVMNNGERGLLGLAFHPLFPDSPYIYVNYVLKNTITTRICRYTLNPNNPNDIIESSKLLLISQAGVQSNHKAGDLAFGPDGYLYIPMGDGGGGGDPSETGQNINTLLGKILRIDVNSKDPGLNYSIPEDNPFANGAGRDEIWTLGMRNPWRISFDRETGDLWIADVGQNLYEEVDMLPYGTPGGANLGWDCQEGNHDYESQNCPADDSLTWPVFEYPHNCDPCPDGYGNSITGGFVYRGDTYDVLEGCYVFADYGSDVLWIMKQTGWEPMTFSVWVQEGNGEALVTFGEDDNGELYAANLNDVLYAVSATGTLPVQWEDLIATKIPTGNKLQWTLHQTWDIDYFEVQRSLEPGFENFIRVAEVSSVPDQITYTYEDPFFHPMSVYYRIAVILNDGTIEYSPVGRIFPDPLSKPSLVFDPGNGQWRILIPEPWQNGDLSLFDVQGKEVFKKKINAEEYIDLDADMPPGYYVVKIKGEMGIWSEEVVWQ